VEDDTAWCNDVCKVNVCRVLFLAYCLFAFLVTALCCYHCGLVTENQTKIGEGKAKMF
jgi:hypothetical protein